MSALPPAEALAVAGILFIALFGLWKGHLEPRLARHRHTAAA